LGPTLWKMRNLPRPDRTTTMRVPSSTGHPGGERMTTDTDVEIKNANIKIAGDDVKVSVQFTGLATIERAQKLMKRLEEVADELRGQTKLA
jgi:hypothetical protein